LLTLHIHNSHCKKTVINCSITIQLQLITVTSVVLNLYSLLRQRPIGYHLSSVVFDLVGHLKPKDKHELNSIFTDEFKGDKNES
jgi:hypothetical protein